MKLIKKAGSGGIVASGIYRIQGENACIQNTEDLSY
jgi:hypothetical protein